MIRYDNLTKVLLGISNVEDKGITFIVSEAEKDYWTYKELVEKAKKVLGALQHKNIKKNDRLVFCVKDNRDFVCIYWGCILGGIVPIPLYDNNIASIKERLEIICSEEKDMKIVVNDYFLPMIKLKDEMLNNVITVEELERCCMEGEVVEVDGEQIALIQYSSGSTSMPKGIILTHKNIICNVNDIIVRSNLTKEDVAGSWMPLSHDMGLIGFHMTPLCRGFSQFLMQSEVFLRNPIFFLKQIEKSHTTLMALPNFGFQFILQSLQSHPETIIDLSCIRVIFNGAEAINYQLCHTFEDYMKRFGLRDNAIFAVYGMAEATLAITFPTVNTPLKVLHVRRAKLFYGDTVEILELGDKEGASFVSVGYEVDQTQMKLMVGEKEAAEKQIGEIYISGPNITKGYLKNGKVEDCTENGWLKTGDLGFLYEGELYITGRIKDIIIIRGHNYYAHDIENMVINHFSSSIADCAACGIRNDNAEDEVALFLVRNKKSEQSIHKDEIGKYVAGMLSNEVKYMLEVEDIPRTASRKKQRYKLVQQFLSGAFDKQLNQTVEQKDIVETHVDYSDRQKIIVDIFMEQVKCDGISLEDTIFNYGANSISATYIMNRINDVFQANIRIDQVFKDFSIQNIEYLLDANEMESESDNLGIQKGEGKEYYPVLPSQEKIYLLNQMKDTSELFHITKLFEVQGNFDIARFEKAINSVVELHDSLRANFNVVDAKVVMKVEKSKQVSIEKIEVDRACDKEELFLMVEDWEKEFSLENDTLIRVLHIKFTDKEFVCFCIHHIITDGTSLGIIIHDIIKFYNGEKVEKPEYSFTDFLAYRERFVKTKRYEEQKKYWTGIYENSVPILEIPEDYPRTEDRQYIGNSIIRRIDMNTMKRIRTFAANCGVSEYIILFGAFNIFLSKYTGKEEFIVGTPVTGRDIPNAEHIVGMLINTLPVRIYVEEEQTCMDYMKALSERVYGDLSNQDYFNEELVMDIGFKAAANRNGIFDVTFNLKNMDIPEFVLQDSALVPVDYSERHSKVDIAMEILQGSKDYVFELEYAEELFSQSMMEKFLDYYLTVLEHIMDEPQKAIKEISLVKETEIQKMVEGTVEKTKLSSFKEMFEEQVKNTPYNIALHYDTMDFTYGELNELSNKIAHFLLAQHTGKKMAALLLGRSGLRLAAQIGCLKAGFAYVPIDVFNPKQRIEYIMEDCETDILLCDERVDFISDEISYCLEDIVSGDYSTANVENEIEMESTAYIIYTSGTTGNPKGVMVSQRNLSGYISAFLNEFSLNSSDKMLHQASYSFDASIEELFPILTVGGSVVTCTDEDMKDIGQLVDLLKKENVTIISVSPLLLNEINRRNESLKIHTYISGGDVLKWNYMNHLIEHASVYNTYGPTEATVCITYHKVREQDMGNKIPIGKVIKGYYAYVMDKNGMLCPDGVIGELYVGGIGVTKGYLKKEELTKEKFVSDPFKENQRLYRTGDLVRVDKDGNMCFISRADSQVKIRGYRIETGEVEQKIRETSPVKDVIVIDKEYLGEKVLAAYFVADEDLDIAKLKKNLEKTLPAFMIPTLYAKLDSIPTTMNGKADLQTLRAMELSAEAYEDYVEPETQTEKALAQLWQEILGVRRIGIMDDFFSLGGHSLNITVLSARIQERFGVKLSIKDLFQKSTIREQAKEIAKGRKVEDITIPRLGGQEYYEVSPAQKRMFIMQELEPETISYNISSIMKITGDFKEDKLKDICKKLSKRHESLRTTFHKIEGRIVQKIHDDMEIEVMCQKDGQNIELMLKEFVKPFHLEEGPLVRLGLFEVNEKERVLIIDVHHIIADGVSVGILVDEFVKMYYGYEVTNHMITYKDYAAWYQNYQKSEDFLRQEKYWMNKMSDELPVLNLPTDFPRPSVQSNRGKRLYYKIEGELLENIRREVADTSTTLYTYMLSALYVLLYRYTGQTDLMVGSPAAGRSIPEVLDVVGMFVNTLVIRNEIREQENFQDFLHRMMESTIEVFENQDYPFDNLVEKLHIKRDMSRNPIFDVLFTLENLDNQEVDIKDLVFERQYCDFGAAQFDLSFTLEEFDQYIMVELEYCTDLFMDYFGKQMLEHYINILKTVSDNKLIAIKDIEMLSADEKTKIVDKWNDTKTEHITGVTFIDLFEEIAKNNPEEIAAGFESEVLTYKMLNDKANTIAMELRNRGIQKNDTAAVLLDRSLEMLLGIFGVLKSGAAYVPIDTMNPPDRIQYVLEDCHAKCIITTSKYMEHIANKDMIYEMKPVDRVMETTENPVKINDEDSIMYVIYTSGTTGQPKGVMVTNKNAISIAAAYQNNYNLNQIPARILSLASVAFDVFVGDMLRSFLNGGTMYLASDDVKKNFVLLYEKIHQYKITYVESTPSLLVAFLDYVYANNLDISSLKIISVGSDVCTMADYKKILERFEHKIRIINSYGVTETTIDSSLFECTLENIPLCVNTPIGKPFDNVKYYILNKQGMVQPMGVIGELYIGGEGVSLGYMNRPEMTAEKFLDNPFVPGEKMYRTGDLGRWVYTGDVEFLGRADNQVKIRGYRIEISEVENKLVDLDLLNNASVVALDDSIGMKHLVAFFTANEIVDTQMVKNELLKNLPQFMIPEYFVQLDEMPLTSNGKVNLRKLRETRLDDFIGERTIVEPSTETEQMVLDIWKELLHLNQIGVTDNFFEVGGQSITAITISSKIYSKCNKMLTVKDIFVRPTVREQAEYLDELSEQEVQKIEKIENKEYYETSAAQKRMYILQRMDPEGTGYNMSGIYKINGVVDKQKMQDALNELIRQEEILRTTFPIVNGEIVQKIHHSLTISISENEYKNDVKAVMQQFVKPFDLETAPLLRAEIAQIGEEKFLLFDIHHIICDGISAEIFMKRLMALYLQKQIEFPQIQYKDYAYWNNRFLKSESMEKQKDFWMGEFAGEIPVLNMATDYPRTRNQELIGDSVWVDLDKDIQEGIRELANQYQSTPYIIFLSALYILLNKYTKQDDIVIGSIVAGRNRQEVESLMGVFINTLALRNTVTVTDAYVDFLTRINKHILEAYENQDYPYETLLDDLKIQHDTSRNPLFDVAFSMEDVMKQEETLDNFSLELVDYNRNYVNFDLRFILYQSDDSFKVKIEYATSLFKESTIVRMKKHFESILRQITKQEDIQINQIELIDEQEREQILHTFNETGYKFDLDTTFNEVFEQQVEHFKDKPAILTSEGYLTYDELNKEVNKFAHYLRKLGVGRNSIVAVRIPRGTEMLTSIYAIIKAGGAYMPIACDVPKARIQYMLENSQANVVITMGEYKQEVEDGFHGIVIDYNNRDWEKEDDCNLPIINEPEDLMYIIYTSGSTGNPKGVMIEHKALINRVRWMDKEYELTEKDVILQKTVYTFDVSVWEIVWWAFKGAKVFPMKQDEEKDIAGIIRDIETYKVTVIHFVPSMFSLFLEYVIANNKYDSIRSLKRIFTSGEALKVGQVESFREHIYPKTGTDLVNLYGPTEAAIDVTYFNCMTDAYENSVPIGKPINNIQLYIVEQGTDKIVPIGVPGELCIAGVGLARGYLNNEKLTTEKFISNPYDIGTRMYRTGDLTRWLEDGNIEYIGRIDHQVKLRGFRIELEEIEKAILCVEGVKEAAVVIKTVDESQILCAYYVVEKEVKREEIVSMLESKLPEYMMPMYYQKLDALPVTSNGKLNLKELPLDYTNNMEEREYVAPRDEMEQKVAAIWEEVLGIDVVGVSDNFFQLGGHSLKITKLLAQVKAELGIEVPFKTMFAEPTVLGLSNYIKEHAATEELVIDKAEEKELYPASKAQKRMYMLQQFALDSTFYNMPEAVIIEGDFSIERAKEVFQKLVNRHEGLRTIFVEQDGEIYQKILKDVVFDVPVEQDMDKEVSELIEDFVKPFDLTAEILFRVKMIHMKENKILLLMDTHHSISDGESKGIIMREFIELYEGGELETLELQYKDYSEWSLTSEVEEELASQKAFWVSQLGDEIPVLEMKTDYPRPSVQDYKGDTAFVEIKGDLLDGIKELCKEYHCTTYMFYLSVIDILLSKYSGQEEILVGSPVVGRRSRQLRDIVGIFINTVVMKNNVNADMKYCDFLESVKQNTIASYENQDYAFEDLVEDLHINRSLARNPIFDVMLTIYNDEVKDIKLGNASLSAVPHEEDIAKFDLNFIVQEFDEDVKLSIQYATSLFKKETIETMLSHTFTLIENILKDSSVEMKTLSMLSEAELEQIREFEQGPEVPLSSQTILQRFRDIVNKYPKQKAVTYQGESLTYEELDSQSNKVAHALAQAGVEKNTVVALVFEKGIPMMCGIVGVLKAGAAYLPISKKDFNERSYYQMEKCNVSVVLGEGKLEVNQGYRYIDIIECFAEEHMVNTTAYKEGDIAYVIFTSGSTGLPKGVTVTNKNVMSLMVSLNELLYNKYAENIQVALIAPFTFDASVKQIFLSLLNGHNLVLINDQDKLDEDLLYEFYINNKITVSDGTPFVLEMLQGVNSEEVLETECFVIGGDTLKSSVVRQFMKRHPKVKQVINIYGPTECSVDSTAYIIDREDELANTIPIGRPIANVSVHILDKNQKRVPVGNVGELYIEGQNVTNGYMNDEETTGKSFTAGLNGSVMYKTGDLGYWLPDGNIEFVGRKDNQHKIRGFRIELPEIELSIKENELVHEAVVVVKGKDYLAAYVVLKEGVDCEQKDAVTMLKESLKRRLPMYMIPSEFIVLDKIPVTKNGKVNYKELSLMERKVTEQKAIEQKEVKCETELEEKLVTMWKDVLGHENFSIHDNFFDVGGNSITAIRIVSMLKKDYHIGIRDIFLQESILNLAKLLESRKRNQFEECDMHSTMEGAAWRELVKEILSFVQEGNRNMQQNILQGSVEYTYEVMPIQEYTLKSDSVIRFTTKIFGCDEDSKARRIVQRAIETFSVLRTRLVQEGDTSFWNVHMKAEGITLPVVDLSHYSSRENEIVEEQILQQMDVNTLNGLLYNVAIIKRNERYDILWCIHHVIFDGASIDILNNFCYEVSVNETESMKKWQEDFSDYVSYVSLIQESLKQIPIPEVEEKFQLEKYQASRVEFAKCINDVGCYDKQNVYTIRADYNVEVDNAFELGIKAISKYFETVLGLSNIPVLTYVYGRNRGKVYYNGIGECVDIVPACVDTTNAFQSLYDTIHLAEQSGISFSNLCMDKQDKYGFYKYVDTEEKYNVFFNYLGYKSEYDMKLYEKEFREFYNSGQQVQGDISFQVANTEKEIVLLVNGLEKDSLDELKAFLQKETQRK